jgi:CDP-glucose 4,6-dehydratase
MEDLGMKGLFGAAYDGKSVLLTGHTGFKGAWMSLWLEELGARVTGYSLPPADSARDLHGRLNPASRSINGNLLNLELLQETLSEVRPDIVFHLAAQALVKASYEDPAGTFLSNAIGTMNLLEAVRRLRLSTSIVCVTTDKVYENREWIYGYRENDPLGGHDPYSASKACAEHVIGCYRKSFFERENDFRVKLASARAGNVIGGGDWADDRIVVDVVKAAEAGQPVVLRSPGAVRPWQHVLEPLAGYLQLGEKLLEGDSLFCDSWNLGPGTEGVKTVEQLVLECEKSWPRVKHVLQDPDAPRVHETRMLKLECSKASHHLGWKPVWDFSETVAMTVLWYRDVYEGQASDIRRRCLADLSRFKADGAARGVNWTS